ncbi:MAG: alpha-L-fucosidase [Stagnimonas sp.]|nr:alpha-L-fucosidase [Stagnimonas sp.]
MIGSVDLLRRGVLKAGLAAATIPGASLAAWQGTNIASYHSMNRLRQFKDYQLGVFVHFGINTFSGRAKDTFKTPATTYAPSALDVDQWVRLAAELGARYMVLVAKHNGGFCMWHTTTTDYSVINGSSDQRDVVLEFVTACYKYNIKPGIYFNWYDLNVLHPGRAEYLTTEANEYIQNFVKKSESGAWWDLMMAQLEELLTSYGSLEMVWLDRGRFVTQPRQQIASDLIRQHQPNAIINMNVGGNAEGALKYAPNVVDVVNSESLLPQKRYNPNVTIDGKDYFIPMEVCASAVDRWVYGEGTLSLTEEQIVALWRGSVDNNTNLLLNFAPDRTGVIPQAQFDVAKRAIDTATGN